MGTAAGVSVEVGQKRTWDGQKARGIWFAIITNPIMDSKSRKENIMYLLNELNKNDWNYEIFTKEYYWCHSEDTAYKAKGSGECLGIRIVVKLNDRYKVSIIQAFNEAVGEFYGDDVYDIAFVDTINSGWRLMPVFYMDESYQSTNTICNGKECIKYIKGFLKNKKLKADDKECLKYILKAMGET